MHIELTPALNLELLKKYNFLELYTPDGGGSFIMRELFGTLDDRVIADMILNTDVMADFGSLEAIDFKRFEKWRTIEKSCWINRCYFIVMLARTAWLNSDEILARKVLNIMLHFGRSCPAPDDLQQHWQRVNKRMVEDYNSKSPEEIAVDETDVEYVWYDMQVAQRLISFLYATFFIGKLNISTAQEQSELEGLLKKHVRVIADQEAFQQPYCDNHQSLRAIALYWGLPLLQDDPDYTEVHQRAFDLCCWHIVNEFMPGSGALFENSPSYHAFVLWHARDLILLAQRRNDAVPTEVQARFEAAKQALFAYRRPDGLALTINDSYQYDASGLADSLGGVDDCDSFAVLKPGGLAVGCMGDCYAAMDVSNFIGEFSHYHGGKNSPVVLWKNEAFLEDAGCPSYDAPEFSSCRRSDWHTTLLVDNVGDTHAYSMYGFDRWAELEYDDRWQDHSDGSKSFVSTLTSNSEAWQDIKWQRKLTLSGKAVKLSDQVFSGDRNHDYTLLFNLAPQVEISQLSENQWLLKKGPLQAKLTFCSAEKTASRIVTICNCQQREKRDAFQLQISVSNCKDFTAETALDFF